jgi:hypothetical protein
MEHRKGRTIKGKKGKKRREEGKEKEFKLKIILINREEDEAQPLSLMLS